MRLQHWRPDDADQRRRRRVRVALLAIGAIALVAGAVVALQRSSSAHDERRLADDQVAQIDLIESRLELAWMHFDLITDGLAAEVAGRDVAPRFASFERNRERQLAELRRLAAAGGDVGALAQDLLEVHAAEDLARWPIDANLLDYLHYESMPIDRSAGEMVEALPGHIEGAFVSMLPRLVLGDALALELSAGEMPAWATEYVEQTADIARATPGWLGPARISPLTNHVMAGPEGAERSYRDVPAIDPGGRPDRPRARTCLGLRPVDHRRRARHDAAELARRAGARRPADLRLDTARSAGIARRRARPDLGARPW